MFYYVYTIFLKDLLMPRLTWFVDDIGPRIYHRVGTAKILGNLAVDSRINEVRECLPVKFNQT